MTNSIETPAEEPKKTTKPKQAAVAAPADTAAAEPIDNATIAKSRFNAAMDDAKAGIEALKGEAHDRAADYRAKAEGNAKDWMEDAMGYAGQAKESAAGYAREGKAKASDALGMLGKSLGDTAPTIDEKLGVKYGDYARSASRQVQEAAVKLDGKSIEELGENARELVRKSPATALGIAAVAGFFLARMFRGGSKD